MDDALSRLARELADAIAAAVAADAQVEACRERARAEGYDMQVSLEAVVGFAPRQAAGERGRAKARPPRRALQISQNDRRFLKSLRISADTVEEVERGD
jgi:hypothetical protein